MLADLRSANVGHSMQQGQPRVNHQVEKYAHAVQKQAKRNSKETSTHPYTTNANAFKSQHDGHLRHLELDSRAV
eukprot:6194033-Pleurochrysis_carterae.AAC.2